MWGDADDADDEELAFDALEEWFVNANFSASCFYHNNVQKATNDMLHDFNGQQSEMFKKWCITRNSSSFWGVTTTFLFAFTMPVIALLNFFKLSLLMSRWKWLYNALDVNTYLWRSIIQLLLYNALYVIALRTRSSLFNASTHLVRSITACEFNSFNE